jgi:hypothetical protein
MGERTMRAKTIHGRYVHLGVSSMGEPLLWLEDARALVKEPHLGPDACMRKAAGMFRDYEFKGLGTAAAYLQRKS